MNNSSPSLPGIGTLPLQVTLQVKGMGHVPSFKNKKRSILVKSAIQLNAEGSPKTVGKSVTERKTKRWMQSVIESFVFQLYSAMQTTGGETTAGRSKRSLIVSSLPLDDSRQWIPEMVITTEEVSPGEEGCLIKIEPID